MSKPETYASDDYAGLNAGGNQFYYGYEYTINDDWCFRAKLANGDIVQVPYTKLGAADQFDVIENLMLGIGWVIARKPDSIKLNQKHPLNQEKRVEPDGTTL